MDISMFEMVEMDDGGIALYRDDDNENPMVVIRFSAESAKFMGPNKLDIAQAMIQAAIDKTSDIADQEYESGIYVERFTDEVIH